MAATSTAVKRKSEDRAQTAAAGPLSAEESRKMVRRVCSFSRMPVLGDLRLPSQSPRIVMPPAKQKCNPAANYLPADSARCLSWT
jgi:hypothetical protein